jgi:hypothetical protein
MWQIAADAMQSALGRHDVIPRQGIETHGGHVFKMAGPRSLRLGTRWMRRLPCSRRAVLLR